MLFVLIKLTDYILLCICLVCSDIVFPCLNGLKNMVLMLVLMDIHCIC